MMPLIVLKTICHLFADSGTDGRLFQKSEFLVVDIGVAPGTEFEMTRQKGPRFFEQLDEFVLIHYFSVNIATAAA
jgi:hypothetical protein